jgi:hypothetical protein
MPAYHFLSMFANFHFGHFFARMAKRSSWLLITPKSCVYCSDGKFGIMPDLMALSPFAPVCRLNVDVPFV